MCRNSSGSKHNVHMVEDLYDSESEDDNYVLTLEERETIHIVKAMQYTKRISAHMVLNDTLVKFELDCGVKVNILPLDIYQEVFDDHQCNHLEKTEIRRETSPGSGQ